MNSNMKRIIASFLLVILAFIVQTCIFPLRRSWRYIRISW